MTLKCGVNRWKAEREKVERDGPTEQAAYERAVQSAGWLLGDLRWHLREDCPSDCDGGRLARWSVVIRDPYTQPGWRDDQSWWYATVEVTYDVAVLCLSRKARDAIRVGASDDADKYYQSPYEDPTSLTDHLIQRPCESATRLVFSSDLQEVGNGSDSVSAKKSAVANTHRRALELLEAWASRFRCDEDCLKLLLIDNCDPKVILETSEPFMAIASATPAATLLCVGKDLGPTVRDNLVEGGFITEDEAKIFWPSNNTQ